MRLWVATGEASGDRLGAGLIERLRLRFPDLIVRGIAGPRLRSLGVEGPFGAEELSVAGLLPVVRRLPSLLLRMEQAISDVHRFLPDVVLTIDSPGFMARLAKRLDREYPLVHWVAPQVWAWRPERIRAFSDPIDGLMCLFPFEPAWFAGSGVRCSWVGHPLLEGVVSRPIPPGPPRIALAPGSRPSEIRAHWPVLVETAKQLRARDPKVSLVVPVASTVQAAQLRGISADLVDSVHDACEGTHAAAVALGTATLEFASRGIPIAAVYSPDPLTRWWASRRLPRGAALALPNLLVGRRVVPEMIGDLDPAVLADTLLALTGEAGEMQRSALSQAFVDLGANAWERVADEVDAWLRGRHVQIRR